MNPIYAPLKIPVFRRAWGFSVLTNLGLLIQGVGVAWVMVEIASRDATVAWVQAASALPLMLLSIPAGAVADVFNRRKVALAGLMIALASATALFTMSFLDQLTPALLLSLAFLTGSGVAFYDPAWQSSVPSLVPSDHLPQAIALRSISHNLARAAGPAIGGLLVAWLGGSAAFFCTAVLYLPLIVVLYSWKYEHATPRLPPERIAEAVKAGLRFVRNSPSTRTIILRAFIAGSLGVGILALMPLAAKYRLAGEAIHYGIMLGAFGVGAVAGAAYISPLRERLTDERIAGYATLALASGALAMALFSSLIFMVPMLVIAGMGWMLLFSTLSISVQTMAPRWVMGRALATYGAATTGGMVFGSLVWGELVEAVGIIAALVALSVINIGGLIVSVLFPLPERIATNPEALASAADIPLALDITYRSGPITVENEYRINPDEARPFYRLMQKIERQRKRNGSYGWTLSRDMTDDHVWIERYHISTWLDYLRLTDRSTKRDIERLQEVQQMQEPGTDIKTRLRLQRPMGSVRWRSNVVDSGVDDLPRVDRS